MYLSSENGYEIVPINKIIIDKSIVEAVKRYNGKIPRGILVSKEYTTPLNRMNPLTNDEGNIIIPSAYYAIRNNIPVPPIILQRYKNTDHYLIVEGRHRVASSLILGYTNIPAFI